MKITKIMLLAGVSSFCMFFHNEVFSMDDMDSISEQKEPASKPLVQNQTFSAATSPSAVVTSSTPAKPIQRIILNTGASVSREPGGGISYIRGGLHIQAKAIHGVDGLHLEGSWTDKQLLDALQTVGVANIQYS